MELPLVAQNFVQALTKKLREAQTPDLISEDGLKLLAYSAYARQNAAVKMGYGKTTLTPVLYLTEQPGSPTTQGYGGYAHHTADPSKVVSLSDLIGASPAVHLSELVGHSIESDYAIVVDGANATQQDLVIRVAGQDVYEHNEFLKEREVVSAISGELVDQGYRCSTSVLQLKADNTVCFDLIDGFIQDDYVAMYRQTYIKHMAAQAYAQLPESIRESEPPMLASGIYHSLLLDAAKVYDETMSDVLPPELVMDSMARPVVVQLINPHGKTVAAAVYCAYDMEGHQVIPSFHWRGSVFDEAGDEALTGPALIGCAVYTAYSSDASLYVTGAPNFMIEGWKPEQEPRCSLKSVTPASTGSAITALPGNTPLILLL